MRTASLSVLVVLSLAAIDGRAAAAQGDAMMTRHDSLDIVRLSATRKAAERGDAAAQCRLGFAYLNGTGVPQDYAEAAKWFRKAADQGHALAQFPLGIMLFSGTGVPKNATEAATWYRKAAEQGHASAQYYLGMLYDGGGGGVPDDIVQAYLWVTLAAQHPVGDDLSEPLRVRAMGLRKVLQARMTSAQVAEAERLSAAWVPRKP